MRSVGETGIGRGKLLWERDRLCRAGINRQERKRASNLSLETQRGTNLLNLETFCAEFDIKTRIKFKSLFPKEDNAFCQTKGDAGRAEDSAEKNMLVVLMMKQPAPSQWHEFSCVAAVFSVRCLWLEGEIIWQDFSAAGSCVSRTQIMKLVFVRFHLTWVPKFFFWMKYIKKIRSVVTTAKMSTLKTTPHWAEQCGCQILFRHIDSLETQRLSSRVHCRFQL